MSEETSGGVKDPAAEFVESRREEVSDFIFRLTGDPGRSSLLARESCLQVVDELPSQASFELIRRLLFQRAYDLNEDALRPLDRKFLERYYRHHYADRQQLGLVYRWELTLLELGHFAGLVLLLIHRFGFSEEDTAEILGRELVEIKKERTTLEQAILRQKKLDLADLRLLPRYGFIAPGSDTETPISAIMRDMKDRQIGSFWTSRRVILGLGLAGIGMFLFGFFWLGRRRQKPKRKSKAGSSSRQP